MPTEQNNNDNVLQSSNYIGKNNACQNKEKHDWGGTNFKNLKFSDSFRISKTKNFSSASSKSKMHKY